MQMVGLKPLEGVSVSGHTGRSDSDLLSHPIQAGPTNPVSDTPLLALIDIKPLIAFLDGFTALVGMTTALLDLKGNILQGAGWQRACTGFHRAVPSSCANCTESDTFLIGHLEKGKFIEYKCKNGMWDVVTPVFVGNQHLGNLFCGQFFYHDDVIDDAFFTAQAERFGYNPVDYLAAIHEVPRVSRERVQAVMRFIVSLADYLSTLSLTNLRLSESRGQMETLLNALPDPVWLKDAAGVFLGCNQAFGHMLGAPVADIRGKTDHDFFNAELADFFRAQDKAAIAGSAPKVNEEWRPSAATGQPILLETTRAVFPGMAGEPIGVLGIARDITSRKRTEESLRLMSKAFSNSGEAILISDADNRILTVNQSFTHLTGYSPEEVIGKNPRFLSSCDTPKEVYQEMWAALADKDYWQGELWNQRQFGTPYPTRLSISVVRDGQGKIVNYIGNFEDITERKRAQDKIRHLAHHDTLTGLSNRFSLHERMDQAIAFARRFNKRLAIMLIDLDHFKAINDTLGHNVGDQLLIQVAQRLGQSVRDSDIVARLGGDEFVIVLSGVNNHEDVAEIADNIIERISMPYSVAAKELRTSPSIGICLYPDDAVEIDELIKIADIAMYQAKAVGRGNYQFYTEKMRLDVSQRVSIERELEIALKEGQFVVHYQPQIEPRSGRVVGFEALVRWQHPARGMIYPGDFIMIAEETRLIIPLGKWVLAEACQQLQRWRDQGHVDLHMSVNLSAVQFQDKELPHIVNQCMVRSGLPAQHLHLEITESMAMQAPEKNIVMMKSLNALGVKLALDDFGTGYSSLAYLKLFPVDIIKIDRAFVMDIETDENDVAICEMTMLLAQKLGMQVIAEGVETDAQLEFLSGIGCHWIQGYLFSRPLPADDASTFIGNSGLASQRE